MIGSCLHHWDNFFNTKYMYTSRYKLFLIIDKNKFLCHLMIKRWLLFTDVQVDIEKDLKKKLNQKESDLVTS